MRHNADESSQCFISLSRPVRPPTGHIHLRPPPPPPSLKQVRRAQWPPLRLLRPIQRQLKMLMRQCALANWNESGWRFVAPPSEPGEGERARRFDQYRRLSSRAGPLQLAPPFGARPPFGPLGSGRRARSLGPSSRVGREQKCAGATLPTSQRPKAGRMHSSCATRLRVQ